MPRQSSLLAVFALVTGVAITAGFTNFAFGQRRSAVGHANFAYLNRTTPEETEIERTETEAQNRVMSGGRFHDALKLYVEFHGVEQPELLELADVNLPASTEVIGVAIDGQSCAFVLNKMLDPTRHIMNLTMNGRAVSVTYCDLADCVRVVGNDANSPLSLHVGGLDVNDKLVLLYDGERFAQESTGLLLTDYPHERMTLGEWVRQHPDTRVCVPPDVTDFE